MSHLGEVRPLPHPHCQGKMNANSGAVTSPPIESRRSRNVEEAPETPELNVTIGPARTASGTHGVDGVANYAPERCGY